MQTSAEIRQSFIEFFSRRHGHTFVPSSPVVPHNDPTLLFSNAGMNQFKDVFLGTGSRPFRRAVNSQKCIRAGGKHNDLDDVGKDTYHHTFFEMLGNWSFGDYFKEEAIAWAWELLTEVWGIDKRRLYVTVFAGDEADGLPADEEAERLWKEVTDIDPSHISRWGKKDNFWEMGDTGPCGPCTEIHYDYSENADCGSLVNLGDERVIEIWNLVFIQFDRLADGSLSALPARHVDTGMGFERIARLLQKKNSNYDTDVWTPLFMAIEQRSGARAYGGSLTDPIDIAYRVIADHARCLTFALTDGAVPGNEGRGYVLRRILRRAVRYGRQTLNVRGPFLHRLVSTVVESFGEAFPELRKDPRRVEGLILEEEESFHQTLDRGIALFGEAVDRAIAASSSQISAEDAFKLHDTYGFPIDLTELMAQERGMSVDLEGYERLMEQARETAREAGKRGKAGTELTLGGAEIARLKHLGIEETDDIDKYHGRTIAARIKAIWNGKDFDNHTHAPGSPELLAIITNRTSFYAEAGGQVGDTGRIFSDNNGEFEVLDTQAFGGYVLHIGRAVRGQLEINDQVQMEVESERRWSIMRHHTGTHLLNHALRETLGDHVDQKGSLVAPDRLRFDFSHNAAISDDDLKTIADRVTRQIEQDLRVYAEFEALESAQKIHGLRAVFGERYPDPVRVVSVGVPVGDLKRDPGNAKWREFSVEFCGGTHVTTTGDIADFAITGEEAVAKGVRRIIAVTGDAAREARQGAASIAREIDELADVPHDRLAGEVAALSEQVSGGDLSLVDRRQLRQRLEQWRQRVKEIEKAAAKQQQGAAIEQARALAASASGEIIAATIDGADAEQLRAAMDVVSAKHPDAAVLLLSADPEANKVAIVAKVAPALISRGLKAGDWVREVAKVCGGGGGGRPDMASAGGKDASKAEPALQRGREFAEGVLKG